MGRGHRLIAAVACRVTGVIMQEQYGCIVLFLLEHSDGGCRAWRRMMHHHKFSMVRALLDGYASVRVYIEETS